MKESTAREPVTQADLWRMSYDEARELYVDVLDEGDKNVMR